MKYNFPAHIKGDTWSLKTFTVTINDVAKDLTGATIQMKVRDCKGVELLSLSVGSGLTLSAPTSGKFQIDEQVLNIAAGSHTYDIQITDAAGVVKTWISGKLIIKQDTTY